MLSQMMKEHWNQRDGQSDRDLIRSVRSGLSRAATDLYRRYADRLSSLARRNIGTSLSRRVEPEDVVQSVFRTFFRRVTAGHYDVPEGRQIWGLLVVIAVNKVRSAAVFHHAAKRDIDRTEPLSSMSQLSVSNEPAALREVIADLTGTLPPLQRSIIRKRLDGFSTSEIATAVNRSNRTVERALQRFRSILIAEIGGCHAKYFDDSRRVC